MTHELMAWLPENYPASRETVEFQGAIQPEIALLWRLRDEFLAQLDPYTATWGLPLWEDSLGLNGCEGLSLDTRRRQVVAKLQGRGTTTVEVVRDLAETMLGLPVIVTEWYSEYRVELEADSGGINMAGPDGSSGPTGLKWDALTPLRERLVEIMPAHLDWQVVVKIWAEYIISTAIGPRASRSEPPRLAVEMPGQHILYGMGTGPEFSLTTPPGVKFQTPAAGIHCAGRCGGPVSRILALPAFQSNGIPPSAAG